MIRALEGFIWRWVDAARAGSIFVVLAVFGLTVAAGVVAARKLSVNTDTSTMLSASLPFQQRAEALRAAFPQIKTDMIVLVRARTPDDADAYVEALQSRLEAHTDVIEDVVAPSVEPYFLQNGLLFLDTPDLEKRMSQLSKASGLIEDLAADATIDRLFGALADNDSLAEKADLGADALDKFYNELAAAIEARLDGAPRPFSWFGVLDDKAGADGVTRILYVAPKLDYTHLQPARPAIRAMRAEIAATGKAFDGRVEALITGDPALRAEELESVSRGIGLSFAVSILLVSVLLVFAFRSVTLSAMTLVSLIVTLVLTTGFAALTVGELNLVSVAFTVLLVGLGLDFSIHFLLHIQEWRGQGTRLRKALLHAVNDVGAALIIAAFTTALAFLSFIPTDFIGIAQLGIIAGGGVLIALAVSFTLLPALMAALPQPKPKKPSGVVRRSARALSPLTTTLAAITVLTGVGALFVLPQVRFDADPMSLRNPDSPSVKAFNMLFDDPATQPIRLTAMADGPAEAKSISEKLKALPEVRSTRSLLDFVPKDQDAKLDVIDFASASLAFALDAKPVAPPRHVERGAGFDKLRAQLAAKPAGSAGARLAGALDRLAEAPSSAFDGVQADVFHYWPMLLDRISSQLKARPVGIDDIPPALAARFRSESGVWRVDVIPEGDARQSPVLRKFVSAVSAVQPDITGGAAQTLGAGDAISHSMLEATLIAGFVVTIFIWLMVRRFSSVLLMLFPLILAGILTSAAGVLLNIPFNYANVIVLPLLIGIGVDSGIHLVMRADKSRHGLFDTATPRAVFFSALTTIGSFGSLMLSPHRGTASMGELLSIAIAFTLICSLIVLPVTLRLLGRDGRIPPPTA